MEPYLTRGVQEGESIEKAITHTEIRAQDSAQRTHSRPKRRGAHGIGPAFLPSFPQAAETRAADRPPEEEKRIPSILQAGL